MKKLLLTMMLFALVSMGYAQTKYYWVGGITEGNISTNTKWNTQLDGSGGPRATPSASDILIIDGENIGGAISTAGVASLIVNSATIAQLKLQNNASVILLRASGNGTLTIANNTIGEAGLTVDATSTLQLGSETSAANVGAVYLDFPTSTASVLGKIKMVQGLTSGTGYQRITSRTKGAIIFENGANLEYDNALGYPFGTIGTGTSNSSINAFVFKSGASLINASVYSPFGATAASPIVEFRSGSNYHVRKTMTIGSLTNVKTFGNVFIENNATLTTDGAALNKIENLTIDFGSNLSVGSQSSTQLPITEN